MPYQILIFEHAFLRHLFHTQAGFGLANHPKGPQTLDLVHQIGTRPLTFWKTSYFRYQWGYSPTLDGTYKSPNNA
ncbi:hypothetical protein HanPI659440_Chr13g0480971 [Helianthus annuus]|nr:hypothetical protein HanPI659440_Chr13g0480971 [Helianthus annuus]